MRNNNNKSLLATIQRVCHDLTGWGGDGTGCRVALRLPCAELHSPRSAQASRLKTPTQLFHLQHGNTPYYAACPIISNILQFKVVMDNWATVLLLLLVWEQGSSYRPCQDVVWPVARVMAQFHLPVRRALFSLSVRNADTQLQHSDKLLRSCLDGFAPVLRCTDNRSLGPW